MRWFIISSEFINLLLPSHFFFFFFFFFLVCNLAITDFAITKTRSDNESLFEFYLRILRLLRVELFNLGWSLLLSLILENFDTFCYPRLWVIIAYIFCCLSIFFVLLSTLLDSKFRLFNGLTKLMGYLMVKVVVCVLWHTDHCRLFKIKSFKYTHIYIFIYMHSPSLYIYIHIKCIICKLTVCKLHF